MADNPPPPLPEEPDADKSETVSAIAAPGILPGGSGIPFFPPLHFAIGQPAPSLDAFIGKLTDQHITEVIKESGEESERKHDERLWGMKLIASVVVSTLLLVVLPCWLFLSYQKTESLEKILALILGFVSGGLGGFGIGRATASKPAK